MIQYIFAILTSLIIGFAVNSSVKIISGSDQALVERLGRYNRTLQPGLRFIWPVIEKIVYYDTVRERVLDIEPQDVITKDQIPLKINAVVFWKIQDLRRAYYDIDQIDVAISNLVLTTLRAEIGLRDMADLFSSIQKMNKFLLETLDRETENWGVKIIRVSLQSVTPPRDLLDAMEKERVARSKKQAEISDAEGKAKSIEVLARSLKMEPNSPEFLQFLIAQRYVESNQKISESPNSKIIFMNPSHLTEAVTQLMDDSAKPPIEKPVTNPNVENPQPNGSSKNNAN